MWLQDVFFKVTETIMETETELGQTQTVPEDLYTWTSSSQAPWALNKSKLDKLFSASLFTAYSLCLAYERKES